MASIHRSATPLWSQQVLNGPADDSDGDDNYSYHGVGWNSGDEDSGQDQSGDEGEGEDGESDDDDGHVSEYWVPYTFPGRSGNPGVGVGVGVGASFSGLHAVPYPEARIGMMHANEFEDDDDDYDEPDNDDEEDEDDADSPASSADRRMWGTGWGLGGHMEDPIDDPANTRDTTAEDDARSKYSCPLCWEPRAHLTSTKCGHVFCTTCILKAIGNKTECPVCRRPAQRRELRRIYLTF